MLLGNFGEIDVNQGEGKGISQRENVPVLPLRPPVDSVRVELRQSDQALASH
jgi:hypothetical protein